MARQLPRQGHHQAWDGEALSQNLQTPAAVEAAFYVAFCNLDGDAMRDLWWSSEEIYCVHPGGPLLTGVDAVLGSWVQIFASADPPKLDYRLLHNRQGTELAVHVVEERIRPAGDKTSKAALVVATNVYVAVADGWRMLSHHASLPMVFAAGAAKGPRVH